MAWKRIVERLSSGSSAPDAGTILANSLACLCNALSVARRVNLAQTIQSLRQNPSSSRGVAVTYGFSPSQIKWDLSQLNGD